MPAPPVTAIRLFIAPERFAPPAAVVLGGAEHHYLVRVLRLRVGDAVVLLDGGGRLGAARVARVDAERVELAWESATTAQHSGPQVILLGGLLKGDKQDFVIQKATELGVSEVVPVVCQRSVPQLGEERAEKRQQRWARIALAAAQQCRRPDVPRVHGP
ncbi:MAG TPA: RsmE family RNA methyltransferase, partial [Pseudomonadota bacterium]|nr:RsmE family RNA methyltransferase [Pseudomonadota bacterium]